MTEYVQSVYHPHVFDDVDYVNAELVLQGDQRFADDRQWYLARGLINNGPKQTTIDRQKFIRKLLAEHLLDDLVKFVVEYVLRGWNQFVVELEMSCKPLITDYSNYHNLASPRSLLFFHSCDSPPWVMVKRCTNKYLSNQWTRIINQPAFHRIETEQRKHCSQKVSKVIDSIDDVDIYPPITYAFAQHPKEFTGSFWFIENKFTDNDDGVLTRNNCQCRFIQILSD